MSFLICLLAFEIQVQSKSNEHIYQAFFPLSNNKDAYISHLALHSQIPRKSIQACLSQHYRLFIFDYVLQICIAAKCKPTDNSNGILTGAAYI